MEPDNNSPDPFGPHHETIAGISHPVMFIALGVAVLLFILGLMMGMRMRRAAAGRDGELVLNDIYKALYIEGVRAASATNGNVIGAASHLLHAIDDRLGAFAKLGGEVKKRMTALEKVRDEVNGAAKAKKDKEPEARTIALMAAGEMLMTTQPPASAEKPSPVDLARLAIGGFNDYWGDRTARMNDLRAARDKLTYTDPVPQNLGQWPGYTGPTLSTSSGVSTSSSGAVAKESVPDPAPTL